MPSRPSAARRRFHTDRVVAKRIEQARALSWIDPSEYVRGRLDDEQWYLGCHRVGCWCCKGPWGHGNRQREDREWRRVEEIDA